MCSVMSQIKTEDVKYEQEQKQEMKQKIGAKDEKKKPMIVDVTE